VETSSRRVSSRGHGRADENAVKPQRIMCGSPENWWSGRFASIPQPGGRRAADHLLGAARPLRHCR
jgi:hypothetical protein